MIKKNLNILGINHDNFVSEKKIVTNQEVENVIDYLQKTKFVYKGKIKAPVGENNDKWEEREQLLFRSTDFGDDKDRVLVRSNGETTYFASDVAYHLEKFSRGFDTVIDVLGADHHGYQGQPGQRRHRFENLDQRVDRGVDGFAQAADDAQRNGND